MFSRPHQGVVLGIDLGTQGLRILAVNPDGHILASAQSAISSSDENDLPPGWMEQNPQTWWLQTCACLQRVTASLPTGTIIDGLAVASTSGTIIPIDVTGSPLLPAIMYNDNRSQLVVPLIQEKGDTLEGRLGYSFGSSFALPKIYWLKIKRPDIFDKTAWFLHAADYITMRLSGAAPVTDVSNALKTGYDLIEEHWPDFIEDELGIPIDRLPIVVQCGMEIGQVTSRAARQTGLPTGTRIFSGATDGTAAQIGSGAVYTGAWNSSLGTTLVVKGISLELVLDPLKRIYCHRHPDGLWMPGGASNTGSEWILREFPGFDLKKLDESAATLLPTELMRYPNYRMGERFPFIAPGAVGFIEGNPSSFAELYAAGLEGLAMLERLCYETLEEIGASVGPLIYATGGGSRSRLWTELRASLLGRQMVCLEAEETAMGAALLAARGAWFASLAEAAGKMVRTKLVIDPVVAWEGVWQDKYHRFIHRLKDRGYLEWV